MDIRRKQIGAFAFWIAPRVSGRKAAAKQTYIRAALFLQAAIGRRAP
jgi:hypothetical protein